MSTLLSNSIKVAPRFQRSIRIDQDFGNMDGLNGYILLSSANHALSGLIQQLTNTPQRAFTWTGPYGGGKSSLALLLATLLGPSNESKKIAKSILGKEAYKKFSNALPSSAKGWLVAPVVGHRGSIVDEISKSFQRNKMGPKKDYSSNPRSLINDLCKEAEKRKKSDGVIILVDEMGKFLEGSAERGDDIYFLQDLAEAASRCKGKLIVIGILHQAFEHYASRLGRQVRDEWAKSQGRFSDIPISSSVDELVDLIGKAIVRKKSIKPDAQIIKNVTKAVRTRRPSLLSNFDKLLTECWPLHPVSSMLLGPIAKHRFGQNERSCFAFLTSAEPFGFQDYLHSTSAVEAAPYPPSRLWDYLQSNLEPSILASPDGHRWAQAAEAVDRCVSKGTADHVRLIKAISIIDLFKNGSGLASELKIIQSCLSDLSAKKIKTLLSDLMEWSCIVFRKHTGAYAVFAGSDFDIEAAISMALEDIDKLDFRALNEFANVQPILAKSFYHQTGALWWLDAQIIPLEEAPEIASSYIAENGATGTLLLAIPTEEISAKSDALAKSAANCAVDQSVIIGVPANHHTIREHAEELLALQSVRANRPELEGDNVARKEIDSRINIVSSMLINELLQAFSSAKWHYKNRTLKLSSAYEISQLASQVASERFPSSPSIQSELLNRTKPSSNAMSGRRNLLYAMAENSNLENLGFEGFPAERGLYETVLKSAGIHSIKNENEWGFVAPRKKGSGSSILPMWSAAYNLLDTAGENLVPISALFDLWEQPPYGLKSGLTPVYVLAFLLSYGDKISLYHNDYYQPDIDTLMIDRMLQKPANYSMRKHVLSNFEKSVLRILADDLAKRTNTPCEETALGVARRLVKLVYALPPWTKETKSASPKALKLKRIFLGAKDPIQALFIDLPKITGVSSKSKGAASKFSDEISELLDELEGLYPNMLLSLRDHMFKELGRKKGGFASIKNDLTEATKLISGSSGDPRLETFISRIQGLAKSPVSFEPIASFSVNRPPRDWRDDEVKLATNSIAELCFRFRQAEAHQLAKKSKSGLLSLAIVAGVGGNSELISLDYNPSASANKESDKTLKELEKLLSSSGLKKEAKLALVARIGVKLATGKSK